MNEDWPQAVAHRLHLGGRIEFSTTSTSVTIMVPCCRKHKVPVRLSKKFPPEVVAKKLMQAGWKVGNKLTCPKHAKGHRREQGMDGDQIDACALPETTEQQPAHAWLLPQQEEAPMTTPTPPPSASVAAKAKQVEAITWLAESFDAEKGVFKGDVSDATIAKETGLSVEAVVALREQFFGELKEPPEIAAFRRDLAACKEKIESIGTDALKSLGSLERRFEALCRKLGYLE